MDNLEDDNIFEHYVTKNKNLQKSKFRVVKSGTSLLKRKNKELETTATILDKKDLVNIINAKKIKIGGFTCIEVKAKGHLGVLPLIKISPVGFFRKMFGGKPPPPAADERVNVLNEQIKKFVDIANDQQPPPRNPITGLRFKLDNWWREKDIRMALEVRNGFTEILLCSKASPRYSKPTIAIARLYDEDNLAPSLEKISDVLKQFDVLKKFIESVREYIEAPNFDLTISCYKILTAQDAKFVNTAIFGGDPKRPSDKVANVLGRRRYRVERNSSKIWMVSAYLYRRNDYTI
jgi:hypothetical protein